jgi:hypothetical protein
MTLNEGHPILSYQRKISMSSLISNHAQGFTLVDFAILDLLSHLNVVTIPQGEDHCKLFSPLKRKVDVLIDIK